jgi:phage anti-repressor protein
MALIEHKLDDRLLNLLEDNFSSEEQKMFDNSFKHYLQYGDDDTAFVIDFDDVWEWLGFTRKDNAKRIMTKNFEEDVHYKIALLNLEEQKSHEENRGGHNKETIMMTVNTFKDFCMLANTEKSKTIRSYYIKMENIMHKYVKEQLDSFQKESNSMSFVIISYYYNSSMLKMQVNLKTSLDISTSYQMLKNQNVIFTKLEKQAAT